MQPCEHHEFQKYMKLHGYTIECRHFIELVVRDSAHYKLSYDYSGICILTTNCEPHILSQFVLFGFERFGTGARIDKSGFFKTITFYKRIPRFRL